MQDLSLHPGKVKTDYSAGALQVIYDVCSQCSSSICRYSKSMHILLQLEFGKWNPYQKKFSFVKFRCIWISHLPIYRFQLKWSYGNHELNGNVAFDVVVVTRVTSVLVALLYCCCWSRCHGFADVMILL